VNIRRQIVSEHKRGGAAAVAVHLLDAANSRAKANPNSWQTATYEVLANDDWFCEEGFREI